MFAPTTRGHWLLSSLAGGGLRNNLGHAIARARPPSVLLKPATGLALTSLRSVVALFLGITGCGTMPAPSEATDTPGGQDVAPGTGECANVAGTWRGSTSGGEYPVLHLQQDDCTVSGSLYSPGSCPDVCDFAPAVIDGSITGATFTFTVRDSPWMSCDTCEVNCTGDDQVRVTVTRNKVVGQTLNNCKYGTADPVSIELERSVHCIEVAAVLFRGGPDFCLDLVSRDACLIQQSDNSAALDPLSARLQKIDPERVATTIIDQANSHDRQLGDASRWLSAVSRAHPECEPFRRLLVGHSWGGDTVVRSGSLGDAYRVTIDPISREISLSVLDDPPQCAFCPFYQRVCTIPLHGGADTQVDVNFLAEDFTATERERCFMDCRLDCLRGYEILGAERRYEVETDHQASIINRASPFLVDLVTDWVDSEGSGKMVLKGSDGGPSHAPIQQSKSHPMQPIRTGNVFGLYGA